MEINDREVKEKLELLLEYSQNIYYMNLYSKKEVKKAKERVKDLCKKLETHQISFEDDIWT